MHINEGDTVVRLIDGSLLMDVLRMDGEVGVVRDDDRWGGSGYSGARGNTIPGDVVFNKDLLVDLVDTVLSKAEQSERGHDDVEVELG